MRNKSLNPVSKGVWKRRKTRTPLSKKASSSVHSTLSAKGKNDYLKKGVLVSVSADHVDEVSQTVIQICESME